MSKIHQQAQFWLTSGAMMETEPILNTTDFINYVVLNRLYVPCFLLQHNFARRIFDLRLYT